LKLLLLFVGSFLAVLILMVGWTILTAIGGGRDSATEAEVQTPPIVIDPKIQSDLTKALAFDAMPTATEVQNPFLDRANLAGNATAAGNVASTNTTGTSNVSAPRAGNNSPSRTTITNVPGSTSAMIIPEADSTRLRWEDWAARANRGEYVGSESETLGIDDLVPVGYAGGGDRPVEVILYSISLCRTFSFPAGTRLFDGTLYQVNQNEVLFLNPVGMRRKSYATVDVCKKDS